MAGESAASTHTPFGTSAPVEHDEPNYIAVFIYLAILTGAELGVYAMGLPRVVMIGLLVALALAKAILVAMYFMHLAMERRGLWIIAGIPMVLIAFAYFMLRPDLSARNWAHEPIPQQIGVKESEPAAPQGAPAESSAQSNSAASDAGQANQGSQAVAPAAGGAASGSAPDTASSPAAAEAPKSEQPQAPRAPANP